MIRAAAIAATVPIGAAFLVGWAVGRGHGRGDRDEWSEATDIEVRHAIEEIDT